MKFLAFAILLFGCGLFIDAVFDQHAGHAIAYSPTKGTSLVEAYRNHKPAEFKTIMAYQWIRAVLFIGAGYFLLSWVIRADSLDPLTPK